MVDPTPLEARTDSGWRNTVGLAEELLLLMDSEFTIRFSNQAVLLSGTSALTWLQPHLHDHVRALAKRARETGLPQHTEVETQNATWYSCWLADVSRDGETIYSLTAHDITELRQAKFGERRAFQALASSTDYILILDREHRIEFTNHPPPGLTEADVLGQPVESWLQPDQVEHVRGLIERAFTTGSTEEYETWTELPQGRRYFVSRVSPLARDGGKSRVTLVARDVTEARAAAVALHESEARYRLLVERSPDAIVLLDIQAGHFTECNPAAEALFGIPREELLGRSPADLSPPTQPDGRPSEVAAREHVARALAGELSRFEWVHRNAAGEDVPCEIWLQKLPDPQGRILVQGNMSDLRARKRAEAEQRRLTAQLQQASKLQAIGQLTGGVAHDFNNLLTVIMGSLDLISLMQDDPAQVEELLSDAIDAAQRGSALTHRLLAFARKQPLQPRSVDLNELLADMEDMLRRTLGETVAVEIRPASELWACEVDPTQLENAILNLAINARDAVDVGGHLTIETSNEVLEAQPTFDHEEVTPGPYVRLAVSDDGSGIAPELIAKVFDPFFTTKDVGKGSGLGLSMVYGFTRQSGGHVKVNSEVGVGTTVELFLPQLTEAGSRSARERRPTPGGSDPQGRGELVLVIEDDLDLQRLSVTMLKRLGYRTLAASTGAAGLELFRGEPEVNLLFTDVVLPEGMSGVDLARAATAQRPGLKVLFTSGYTQDALIRDGRIGEDVALLEKPFTFKQLARRVRGVLDAP